MTTIAQPVQQPVRVGYSPLGLMQSARMFKHDPLGLFTQLAESGDLVPFRFLGMRAVFINHPDLVKTILVGRPRQYTKRALLLQLVKPLLGDSLISSEGEVWRTQRHAMQPAFHRTQVAAWGAVMTTATQEMLDQWAAYAQRGESFEAMPDLMHLTLRIAGRALLDVNAEAERFTALFAEANRGLSAYFTQPFPPLPWPSPRNVRLQATIWRLRRDAARLLRVRLQDRAAHHDLLALLLAATDEQGRRMRMRRLRDNVLALLFAGYETTAVALAWALTLLAQHPIIQTRAAAEVQRVLGERVPTTDDLAHLPYTRMVVDEALRYYPPPSFLVRLAEQSDMLVGVPIHKGTLVFICPYTLHRHRAFWPNPEEFDPERFTPEQSARRPRLAYIPFNTGPHQCIGNQFALTELQLTLTMVLQRYKVALPAGQDIQPEALLSLRPRGGHLPVILQPRALVESHATRWPFPLYPKVSGEFPEQAHLLSSS